MDKKKCEELVISYGELLESNCFTPETVAAVLADDAFAILPHAGEGKGIMELVGKHCEMMGPFTGATHNITNIVITPVGDNDVKATWHMEVVHQFRPEIAQNLPGDLFIVNDLVSADLAKQGDTWKISRLSMDTKFKYFISSARD